jgi:hypothetical protein
MMQSTLKMLRSRARNECGRDTWLMFVSSGRQVQEHATGEPLLACNVPCGSIKTALIGQNDAQRAHSRPHRALFSK